MEIGVLLDADRTSAEELVELARTAEEHGIGIAVIDGRDSADPWAVATWIAGVTTRLRVGVPAPPDTYDPLDPDSVVPAVAAKATTTLAALAPDRELPPGARWTEGDPSAGTARSAMPPGRRSRCSASGTRRTSRA